MAEDINKNAIVNPMNIGDKFFQDFFALLQHCEETLPPNKS